MECNREEAERASEFAEEKFKARDLHGAKRLALKAQSLCPSLPNLPQVISAYEVHIAAATKKLPSGATDWHAVLGVDPSADHATIKKQFKKMCIFTHPDKNKSAAADGAFKIIMEAWSILSLRLPICPTKPEAQPDGTNSSRWEHLRALISCSRCKVDFVWAFRRSRCTHNLYYYCKKCRNWTLIGTKQALTQATLTCSCSINLRWGTYRFFLLKCGNCKNRCDVGVDPNWVADSEQCPNSGTPQDKQIYLKPSCLACPYCGAWNKYMVDKNRYSVKCKTCDAKYIILFETRLNSLAPMAANGLSMKSQIMACPYCGNWDDCLVDNNKSCVQCKTCGIESIVQQETGSSSTSSLSKRRKH